MRASGRWGTDAPAPSAQRPLLSYTYVSRTSPWYSMAYFCNFQLSMQQVYILMQQRLHIELKLVVLEHLDHVEKSTAVRVRTWYIGLITTGGKLGKLGKIAGGVPSRR